jgi:hypothetical protein
VTPAKHFLLGSIGSILAGLATAVLVIYFGEWLEKYRVQPLLAAFGGFILVTWLWRWFFRNFVGLRCPKCHRKDGFEIPGTTGRFRCTDCGTEF